MISYISPFVLHELNDTFIPYCYIYIYVFICYFIIFTYLFIYNFTSNKLDIVVYTRYLKCMLALQYTYLFCSPIELTCAVLLLLFILYYLRKYLRRNSCKLLYAVRCKILVYVIIDKLLNHACFSSFLLFERHRYFCDLQ